MASAGGGVGATDEIPEVEREVVERAPEEPGRVGSKRVRDSPSALGSHGFYGVTTAKKKPMLQLHNVDKNLSKAGNSNLLHMNSDGASKVGGRYLHGTDGLGTPDSSALRGKKMSMLQLTQMQKPPPKKKNSGELLEQTRAIDTKCKK